jgi:hypothetical protein
VKFPARAVARFLLKVDIDPRGCWIWTGDIGRGGYGRLKVNGRNVAAHRFAYELFVGPIPEDRPQIDHVRDRGCTSRACVNPWHLEPVTNAENHARGERANATHCVNGHPYDEVNTYVRPARAGKRRERQCRRCNADAQIRYRNSRKEAA